VNNLSVHERYNNITVRWTDPHSEHDPVEFVVYCNGSSNVGNAGRYTSFICPEKSLEQADRITVITRVMIPDYEHDEKANAFVDGQLISSDRIVDEGSITSVLLVDNVPSVPGYFESTKTTSNIQLAWDHKTISNLSNAYYYTLQCGEAFEPIRINVTNDRYLCENLQPGTIYNITMTVSNADKSIQRTTRIEGRTCE
jgi:hypothetical protein